MSICDMLLKPKLMKLSLYKKSFMYDEIIVKLVEIK